jgi:hypothetical protein
MAVARGRHMAVVRWLAINSPPLFEAPLSGGKNIWYEFSSGDRKSPMVDAILNHRLILCGITTVIYVCGYRPNTVFISSSVKAFGTFSPPI